MRRRTEPLVSLELGTSHVRAFVAEPGEHGGLALLGMGECGSQGIRKGELVHFESVVKCVQQAVEQAEEKADVTIAEVHLALSGAHIEGQHNVGTVSVEGAIDEDDLERARNAARDIALPPDHEVLHHLMGRCLVDGALCTSPIDMVGRSLSQNVLVVHGLRSRMINLVKAVKSLNLGIRGMSFSGMCSAMATLTPDQRYEDGALLVDLGAGTTDWIVWTAEGPAAAGAIGVGGDHVTHDISYAFHIPNDLAERIKIEHGDALLHPIFRTRRLNIQESGLGKSARSIRLYDLHNVISLRMEETLGLIRARLDSQKLLTQLKGGVVLTGGGARMANILQLAENIFGLPCAVGEPRGIDGLSKQLLRPEYATGLGALLYAEKTEREQAARAGGFWRKLGRWIGW